MKEDVGLIIFEHLGYKLHVHVLDVDFLLHVGYYSSITPTQAYLKALIHNHDRLIQLFL